MLQLNDMNIITYCTIYNVQWAMHIAQYTLYLLKHCYQLLYRSGNIPKAVTSCDRRIGVSISLYRTIVVSTLTYNLNVVCNKLFCITIRSATVTQKRCALPFSGGLLGPFGNTVMGELSCFQFWDNQLKLIIECTFYMKPFKNWAIVGGKIFIELLPYLGTW